MDEQSLQKSYDSSYVPSRSARKSRRLVLILFIFILVIGGIVAGTNYLGSREDKESRVTPTPSPAEEENEIEFVIETPAPTVDKESKETSAPSPSPTPTVDPIDKDTGLDRSMLSIEILNGSGVTGAASKASETLKGFGYKISSIGNAETTDYENVTIKVKSDKEKFLDLLKKDLGFSYTIGSSSADLAEDVSSDAVVIVGK